MTFEFYKVLHIAGLLFLFFGLSATLTLKMAGVQLTGPAKKMAFATHGIGLLVMLVAGFGMLAKLGIMASLPGWALAKFGIWILLGASIALAKRKGQLGWPLILLFIALGTCAAWLAIAKPF